MTTMRNSFLMTCAVASLLAGAPARAAQTWTVSNLHPDGASESYAVAVSPAYQAGRVLELAGGLRPAVWHGTAASYTPIMGPYGGVSGIDSEDKVGACGGRYAALWRGPSHALVDLHPSWADVSAALATFGGMQAGYVVVGPGQPQYAGYHAAIWHGSADTFVDLSPVGAEFASIGAVDATGQAGAFRLTNMPTSHAALWHGTAESVVDLHPAGAYASQAQAISNGRQGGYVQFERDGPSHAALWSGSAESFFDLNSPGGPTISGAIYGMDGNVQVGQAGFVDGTGGATVWFGTPDSAFYLGSLLPDDYSETWAYAVDVDEFGTIRVVGSAYNENYYLPNGTHYPRYEAMMWVLVPEPSSLAALAAGLAGLAAFRRRR